MPDPKSPELTKRYVGLLLGPLLFVLVWAWPMGALSPKAHLLAAVFAWTVTYWVTEALPVPVTAVFSSVLSIVLGVAPAKTVLASYGDPIIFLFIGSFMLAEAMYVHGLDRRIAFQALSMRWVGRSPARVLVVFGGRIHLDHRRRLAGRPRHPVTRSPGPASHRPSRITSAQPVR